MSFFKATYCSTKVHFFWRGLEFSVPGGLSLLGIKKKCEGGEWGLLYATFKKCSFCKNTSDRRNSKYERRGNLSLYLKLTCGNVVDPKCEVGCVSTPPFPFVSGGKQKQRTKRDVCTQARCKADIPIFSCNVQVEPVR